MAVLNKKVKWLIKSVMGVTGVALTGLAILVGAEIFSQRETKTENIYDFMYKGNPSSLVKETKYITNLFGPILGEKSEYYIVLDKRDIIKEGALVTDNGDTLSISRRPHSEIYTSHINGEQIE